VTFGCLRNCRQECGGKPLDVRPIRERVIARRIGWLAFLCGNSPHHQAQNRIVPRVGDCSAERGRARRMPAGLAQELGDVAVRLRALRIRVTGARATHGKECGRHRIQRVAVFAHELTEEALVSIELDRTADDDAVELSWREAARNVHPIHQHGRTRRQQNLRDVLGNLGALPVVSSVYNEKALSRHRHSIRDFRGA